MHEFQQKNPEVPVMSLSFEDMKKNPKENVKKVAQFLGLKVTDSLIAETEEACRFDNMKKQSSDKQKPIAVNLDLTKVEKPEDGDGKPKPPRMVLFRKGEVGDWKNHLTVAMSERMDQLVKEKMEGLPFSLQFE